MSPAHQWDGKFCLLGLDRLPGALPARQLFSTSEGACLPCLPLAGALLPDSFAWQQWVKTPACPTWFLCHGARCVAAHGSFSSSCHTVPAAGPCPRCLAAGSPVPAAWEAVELGSVSTRSAPAALCFRSRGFSQQPLSPPGKAGGVQPCSGAPVREGQRKRRRKKRKTDVGVCH